MTPTVLEAMNGTLFVLLVFACFMFGVYILREVWLNGFQRTRLQAAIAILVCFAGDGVVRGRVWYWRHCENLSLSPSCNEGRGLLLLGALIEIIGVVCIIRVFSPDNWGRNVWFISSLIAIGIATAFVYL